MPSDRDIWVSAKLYIDRHGEDAPIEAAMRADVLAEEGDYAGQRAWLRIIAAIEWLRRQPGQRPVQGRSLTGPVSALPEALRTSVWSSAEDRLLRAIPLCPALSWLIPGRAGEVASPASPLLPRP